MDRTREWAAGPSGGILPNGRRCSHNRKNECKSLQKKRSLWELRASEAGIK